MRKFGFLGPVRQIGGMLKKEVALLEMLMGMDLRCKPFFSHVAVSPAWVYSRFTKIFVRDTQIPLDDYVHD